MGGGEFLLERNMSRKMWRAKGARGEANEFGVIFGEGKTTRVVPWWDLLRRERETDYTKGASSWRVCVGGVSASVVGLLQGQMALIVAGKIVGEAEFGFGDVVVGIWGNAVAPWPIGQREVSARAAGRGSGSPGGYSRRPGRSWTGTVFAARWIHVVQWAHSHRS